MLPLPPLLAEARKHAGDILLSNSSALGLLGGGGGAYRQVWGRDSMICGLASESQVICFGKYLWTTAGGCWIVIQTNGNGATGRVDTMTLAGGVRLQYRPRCKRPEGSW